tara:strand:- start:237 stop:539 length:303 start_codon:yes stop_codon:yes gene_type:complete
MNQTSFFERLLLESSDVGGLEIGFPNGYKFDNFAMLKQDLESVADKYGLALPVKLKRGKLIFELKTTTPGAQAQTIRENSISGQSYSLSTEEVKAIECAF